MRLKPSDTLTRTILLTLIGFVSTGFVAPEHNHSHDKAGVSFRSNLKEHVIRPDIKRSVDTPKFFNMAGVSEIHTDELNGEIRVVSGKFSSQKIDPQGGQAEFLKFIEDWIDSPQGQWAGLQAKDLKLLKKATLFDSDNQFFKFQVYRNGLLIHDANVDFRFKFGYLVQVINQGYTSATEEQGQILADLDEHLPRPEGPHALADSGYKYRVQKNEKQDAYELVKVREYYVTDQNGESYIAHMNVRSGQVLEYKSQNYHYALEAKGQTYPRWHTQALQSYELKSLKLGDQYTDRDGRIEDAGDQAIELGDLHGKYVKVYPKSGTPVSGTAVLNEGVWQLNLNKPGDDDPSQDKSIAQVMVYRDTDFISRYAAKYIDHEWLERPLTANVNLTRSCNAHYSGNTINLYSGSSQCANTGLISDVTYHEWGHALDDQTGGIDDGAFSEGFGDIVSLLISRSPKLGIGFRLPGNEPVRDLDPDKIYPQDANGGVHAEGQIIGSTFWDLYVAFEEVYGADEAANKLSNYAFKMILAARTYRDVYQAILAIDDNNGDLGDGSPNLCLVNKIFTQHGLAEESVACKLAAVESWDISGDTDADGYIEPGETFSLNATIRNASNQTIEGLNGQVSIDGAVGGITVSRSAISWDTVPSGSVATGLNPAEISVDQSVACGTAFKVKLLLKSGEKQVVQSKDMSVGRSVAGQSEMFGGAGLPAPVEDQQTTTSEAVTQGEQWTETTVIESARLKFDITHTYVGDLTVKLIAPDGTEFEVYKGSGSSDDVHVDKDISSMVKGLKGKGAWTLSVHDKANRDEGTLDTFELSLVPANFVCD